MLLSNLANIFSFSRILVVPVFLFAFFYDGDVNYINNNFFSKIVTFVIVIYSIISDGLDGYYARKYNSVSVFGKYLDPFSDKILNITIFLCFLATGFIATWMVVLIYFREAGVESLRTLAANQGVVLDARRSGKWKTAIQMIGISVILFGFILGHIFTMFYVLLSWNEIWFEIVYYLVFVIMIVTIASGVDYFYHNRYLFKSKRKKS